MNRFPALRNAMRALSANKVRTLLTMLGVIIGVSAVVIMVSLGAGAGKSVSSRIESLGSNLVTVTAGSGGGQGGGARAAIGSGTTLNVADSDAIAKQIPGVARVSPEYSGSAQVVNGAENVNATINGVTPAYDEVRNAKIDVGRFIDETDLANGAAVAVIGRNVVDDLFGGENPVGQGMRIGAVRVQIIGVLAAKGGSGSNSPDDAIFVPLTTAQRRLFGEDHLRQIGVQLRDSEAMAQADTRISLLLMGRHGVSNMDEADFRILNQQDILETASQITGIFTLLLGGIAGVSLLVGGIGIMNIMLVSVTERTREIGLRKAVGARRADILRQFLIESVVLSVGGGIIGIALGMAGSRIVAAVADFSTVVTPGSVILAFSSAMAIGIFFGVFPATRAARLNPIEALRSQ